MASIKFWLLQALVVVLAGYILIWVWSVISAARSRTPEDTARRAPGLLDTAIGFFADFLDTLGIGSFATTTSTFKLCRLVPDELVPGTLNVGHAIPTIAEAFIFVSIIRVDMLTLVLMIAASVAGAWLGAGWVSKWPRRYIQIGMGVALLVAAAIFVMAQLNLFPAGGNSLSLEGPRLWIGLAGNFVLGALMTVGVGLYAPCMILVSFLAMDPHAAFPIMMGSCAFLMPVGSVRFIRSGRYSLKAAAGLALGGVPGVLIAAFIVKSLPLGAIRWLVVAVVVYTSAMMLRSARLESRLKATSGTAPAAPLGHGKVESNP